MKKRLFALILTLSLLLPLVPAPARAAETDLESEIRQQLTAYISTLGKPDASGAKTKLINHALYGKGKYLSMGETDVFTVAALNTNLLQEDLVQTLAEAIKYASAQKTDILYIGGSANWYDADMSFGNHVLAGPSLDYTDKNKRVASLNSFSKSSGWTMSPNICDDVMVDVVGGSTVRMAMWKTAVTADTVTWQVDLLVKDAFNFDSGFNISNLIGNWLTGSVIDTYSWDFSAGFSFSVTNTCPHHTENYRWEFDGTNLYAAIGSQQAANGLTTYQTANGNYYETARTVHLSHDQPWVLEFRMQGSCHFVLTPTYKSAAGMPYFHKVNLYMWGAEGYESTQNEKLHINSDCHGVNFTKNYHMSMHTYRLENRIGPDGTAMVYLLLDGDELGPMESHWEYRWDAQAQKQIIVDMHETTDWIGSADFEINYIFNRTYPLDSDKVTFEYIQIWENGEGNAPYSYFETTTIAPTCDAPGKTVHICTLCGASYEEATGEPALGHTLETLPGTAATCETEGLTEGAKCTTCGETVTAQEAIPALGHAWDEGVVTTSATCTTDGEIRFTCNHDPSHTRVDTITPPGHTPGDPASCTAAQTCNSCGFELSPALGHTWSEGETVTRPSPEADGVTKFTCSVCGEIKEETQKYEGPIRIAGRDRFETALLTADRMKKNLGIEKFDAVIVASGLDFADALAGSYLASTQNAPILLAYTKDSVNDGIRHYIRENLKEGGTVYILGGNNAVPAAFEEELETFQVKRLAGDNRFETNLLILKEAGISDKPLLISTGLTFADSLSASAAKLPILLVYGDKLLPEQADFLTENAERPLYILGGEGAISAEMEENLKNYGQTERIAGQNRFETSVKIAEKFFNSPESAVLAYAWDFPDGLCGGSLAVTMNAPLILTMAKYEDSAANYVQSTGISKATILGGEKLIPDTSVDLIMK